MGSEVRNFTKKQEILGCIGLLLVVTILTERGQRKKRLLFSNLRACFISEISRLSLGPSDCGVVQCKMSRFFTIEVENMEVRPAYE